MRGLDEYRSRLIDQDSGDTRREYFLDEYLRDLTDMKGQATDKAMEKFFDECSLNEQFKAAEIFFTNYHVKFITEDVATILFSSNFDLASIRHSWMRYLKNDPEMRKFVTEWVSKKAEEAYRQELEEAA